MSVQRAKEPRSLRPLLVPRDRGQPVQILQQDAAALQVQDAVLAPGLELTVDAFARRADEHPEVFLGDVHLGAEIGGERAEPARQPGRQRMRWHSSMMILIATFGSRSRWPRKSSRRSTNNSVGSPAVASAVRLWPSRTGTSSNRSPWPIKIRVRRLPSDAPVSIRIWPRRTPNRAAPGSPFWNSISPTPRFWV